MPRAGVWPACAWTATVRAPDWLGTVWVGVAAKLKPASAELAPPPQPSANARVGTRAAAMRGDMRRRASASDLDGWRLTHLALPGHAKKDRTPVAIRGVTERPALENQEWSPGRTPRVRILASPPCELSSHLRARGHWLQAVRYARAGRETEMTNEKRQLAIVLASAGVPVSQP